MTEVQIF